ncbi:site-specific integrase [Hymenobacter lapidarius]|uniref:site-specific integrase n=1 Tax=Hymenobacter lapidarius TaxID=1908237 RepID=UPI000F7B9950|nr:site-specific integrase [Hymenobacter lapidarius]
MTIRKVRNEAVRNWPFQPLPFDRSFTLSPLEKTALAAWKARGHMGRGGNAFTKQTRQQLDRLIQPIEAVLLQQGFPKGGEYRLLSCVSLLLHEMHRRQTSLWAWDDIAWIETVGKTLREFKGLDNVFQGTGKKSACRDRQCLLACAYHLCEIPIYQLVTGHLPLVSAQCMFGRVAVEKAMQTLTAESNRIGRTSWMVSVATCSALLANRCPDIEKLTLPVLEKLYEKHSTDVKLKRSYITLSTILYNLKVLPSCLPTPWKGNRSGVTIGIADSISADWARLIQAWFETSEESGAVRNYVKAAVAKAARWAAEKYPSAACAQQWTKNTAIAYVAAVSRMNVGQWQHPKFKSTPNLGKPLRGAYQTRLLASLRMFFKDCHEWEWFSMTFKPDRYLATPRSVYANQGPNPRPIGPALWIKLLEAGLSLTKEDFPVANSLMVKMGASPKIHYPLDMNRAMALVWLYTGLRSDEIYRLQVGCIRPTPPEENESSSSLPVICSLTVPVGKNGFGFSKPVPGLVGNAIEKWERIRPSVPKHWDYKTSEAVDFLFVWRGKQVGTAYLNGTIIPVLCRKAGISVTDALGKITSHRARHTLAPAGWRSNSNE